MSDSQPSAKEHRHRELEEELERIEYLLGRVNEALDGLGRVGEEVMAVDYDTILAADEELVETRDQLREELHEVREEFQELDAELYG